MNEREVVQIVREAIKRAGGVRALAREWNVSPTSISLLTAGHRSPQPKILAALGLTKVKQITFEKRATVVQRQPGL